MVSIYAHSIQFKNVQRFIVLGTELKIDERMIEAEAVVCSILIIIINTLADLNWLHWRGKKKCHEKNYYRHARALSAERMHTASPMQRTRSPSAAKR